MKYFILLFFPLFILFTNTYCQTITNVVAKQETQNVVITYSLQCDSESEISVYIGRIGETSFIGPLKSVTGDVGNGIKSGKKKIVWDVLQDNEMFLGDSVVFRIFGSIFGHFTDSRDGKTYKSVKIGNQTWMAENLAYKASSGCWTYPNNENLEFGYYYNLETAHNVCPAGWHLPSDDEWNILADYLGGSTVAGDKLKEAGTTHWEGPNSLATNTTGFTGLPSGSGLEGGSISIGYSCDWWAATRSSARLGWTRGLFYTKTKLMGNPCNYNFGCSVRCIKN
jgi:uncharacterized protein (TIGR02145 family)